MLFESGWPLSCVSFWPRVECLAERKRERSFRLSPRSLPYPVQSQYLFRRTLLDWDSAVPSFASLLSPAPSYHPPFPLSWSTHVAMYPISDLTTFCRKTLGDVPPKLVVCISIFHQPSTRSHTHLQGASTTVVGSKVYLYVCPNLCFSAAIHPRLTSSPSGRSSRRRASDGHRHLHVRHRHLHLGKGSSEP